MVLGVVDFVTRHGYRISERRRLMGPTNRKTRPEGRVTGALPRSRAPFAAVARAASSASGVGPDSMQASKARAASPVRTLGPIELRQGFVTRDGLFKARHLRISGTSERDCHIVVRAEPDDLVDIAT